MDLKANCGIWGTMFGVPCIVADNFLKLASGEQIKVLLYLLRSSGRTVSTEEIAANTGVAPDKAEEAVMFWQQVNVLTAESSQTAPIQDIMTAPQTIPPQSKPAEETAPAVNAAPPRRTLLRSSDIAEIMTSTPDISELFKITESILGTLNHSMQNSLIWMNNYLGLKKEVIITLVNYCMMISKTNSAYIEKIASSWSEKGISTLESAQEEVERLTSEHTFVSEIRRTFEMNHNPTTGQKKYIEEWQKAGYSMEIIHYAYEITMERINKLSFEYINKILLSWQESGLRTVDEIKAAESDFRKNKKPDKKDNSDGFDADKYSIFINRF